MQSEPGDGRILVGSVNEFRDEIRVIVSRGKLEIGVLRHQGRFHAFGNLCAHQGGPVCEGILIGKIESRIGPDQQVTRVRFSTEKIHLVCPWHGWEYDLETGINVADPSIGLTRYEVEVDGHEVYVVVR
jgi:nitrite reductase (NADH) small subunit